MIDRPKLDALEKAVEAFASDRDWAQFHDPKNLAMAIASEAGELCALLRWINNAEADQAVQKEPLRSAFLSEMGDVGILLLLLCRRLDVSFADAVLNKLASNALK